MAPESRQSDLVPVDLDSDSETCSTTTSLNVLVSDDDVNTKRLESPLPNEDTRHLTSDLKTFMNTCIAFLGSGVLGLPYAFRQTGILTGLVTLVSVAAVSTYAMLLVLQCKYKLQQQGQSITTYGDIGYFAMGPVGSIIVNTALVISQTGFCIAYLIFIASNAEKFLDLSKELVVLVCVPPLVGFSLLKHMRQLAYLSVVADLMCVFGLVVVLHIDLTFMEYDYDDIQVVGVASAIPFFFGVASYCFEGVGMVLPLEQSMKNKQNFTPILVSTVVIITSLYATFGICGYLAFGNDTDAIITLNFEGSDVSVMLVKVFLCLGLFFTYPVMLYPVFEVLQPLTTCSKKRLESPLSSPQKDVALRASIVLFTAVIAAEIPDFGRFISFLGSTCCSLLAFILPACFHLCLFRNEPMTWKNRLHQFFVCAMMALGFGMFSAGIIEAIKCVL